MNPETDADAALEADEDERIPRKPPAFFAIGFACSLTPSTPPVVIDSRRPERGLVGSTGLSGLAARDLLAASSANTEFILMPSDLDILRLRNVAYADAELTLFDPVGGWSSVTGAVETRALVAVVPKRSVTRPGSLSALSSC